MLHRLCRNCGSQDIEPDASGKNCCTKCGTVLDEESIVSTIGFNFSKPEGTFMQAGSGSRRHNAVARDSHEITLSRAKREIQKLATNMKLSQQHADAAFRLYTLAQAKNFIQGRKTMHVMAVSLYIACRMQKTPHLLIDFADFLGVDLFKLGQCYLKMVKLLFLQLPLIDPSLFIHRFCSKLNFQEKAQQVALTALRILKRMKRDWMSYGRRPSGLCGAAILIAARYHGFKRSTQQILQTVRVCNDTIRKRLEEFQNLPVASLTRDEFEALNLDSEELGESDPPCFKSVQVLEESQKALMGINDMEGPPPALPEVANTKDSFSDVDDEEIDEIILTPEESALKRIIWNHINSDWLETQRMRDEKKEADTHKPRKPKRAAKPPLEVAEGPADALLKSGRLSRRTDEEALTKLLERGEKYEFASLTMPKK